MLTKNQSSLVWDLPLRLFHWLLVISVFGAWLTAEVLQDMTLHFYCGYLILGLLIFRVVWGLVGPVYAKFFSLQLSLSRVKEYFIQLKAGQNPVHAGHNPMGSWSVVVMLTLLLTQATTGLFASDDYLSGPLYHYVSDSLATLLTEIHHKVFKAIQLVILIHLLAICYYQLIKKDRLVQAMIHGRKNLDEQTNGISSSRIWLGFVVAVLAGLAVYGIVLLEPEIISYDW